MNFNNKRRMQSIMRYSKLGIMLVLMLMNVASCKINEKETNAFKFQDPSLSVEERAKDLVSQMTLKEKVSQMRYDAPEIERLGIPAYNWWNECLHGVARAGEATVFPQAIGMGATWNAPLIY